MPSRRLIVALVFAGWLAARSWAQDVPPDFPSQSSTASVGPVIITQSFPPVLYVQVGSTSSTFLTLDGSNLASIRGALVYNKGNVYKPVLARLSPAVGASIRIYFLAAEAAEVGTRLRVAISLKDGSVRMLGSEIEIVSKGDARAKITPIPPAPNTTGKTKKLKQDDKLTIDLREAPVVAKTEPFPIVVYADGTEQTVRLIGQNLEKIDDVRVRAWSNTPTRIPGEGKLPFVKEKDGSITLQLMTAEVGAVGRKLALDLLMKGYIASTLEVTIGDPAKRPPSPNPLSIPPPETVSPAPAPTPPATAPANSRSTEGAP